jgi:lipopolysaccharide transport system permease protein
MIKDFEYSIEPSGKKLYDWRELWQYRELFYFFTWRDVKVKYKQTTLGVIWVVLQPVLSVAIFTFFIGHALKVPSDGLPYPVFVFSGLLLWTVFSASVNAAGNSMISSAPIIKKIYFPRIIIPISAILVCFVDFLISFGVFILLLLYYRMKIEILALIVSWPAAVLLVLVTTLGVCCWLAALNVKFRDFRFVIPFAVQIGLFITPVLYPISSFTSKSMGYIMALNPLYGAIMLFRAPFGFPVNVIELFISIASGLLLLLWGLYYFKKTEAYFADIA